MIAKFIKYRNVISVLFFIFLFFTTFDLYRYYFDVDGIGSMTIALRIQNHDWFRSINGFWSPLNYWIAASIPGLTKNPLFVFKFINAFCSICIIILFHLITNQLIIVKSKGQKLFSTALSFVLPVILLSYTHVQLAGDVLQLTIVLLYLYVIFKSNIFKSIFKSIGIGIIITAASFAKAFNFPFLLISHLIICLITIKSSSDKTYHSYIKSLIITYTTIALLIAPWIYLIHLKYGVWSFSTAGQFNFNYLLNDQSYNTLKTSELLLKPPYPDSPSPWEDPYIHFNYSTSGPFASLQNFIHFFKNILHNLKILTSTLSFMSFLNFAILFYFFVKILSKNISDKNIYILIFMSSFILFGYTLILMDERYIWLSGILLLIAGSKIIIEKFYPIFKPATFFIISLVFFASFLLRPADYLQDMRQGGKDLYDTDLFFKSKNLKGNFTSIITNINEGSWCDNIAFISHNHYYSITRPNFQVSEFIQSCRRNNISFILYFYRSEIEKNLIKCSELVGYAKEISQLPGKNILILKL